MRILSLKALQNNCLIFPKLILSLNATFFVASNTLFRIKIQSKLTEIMNLKKAVATLITFFGAAFDLFIRVLLFFYAKFLNLIFYFVGCRAWLKNQSVALVAVFVSVCSTILGFGGFYSGYRDAIKKTNA